MSSKELNLKINKSPLDLDMGFIKIDKNTNFLKKHSEAPKTPKNTKPTISVMDKSNIYIII